MNEDRNKMVRDAFQGAWEDIKRDYGKVFMDSMAFIERLFPDVEVRMDFIFSTMGLGKDRMPGIIHAMHYLEERLNGLQKTIDTYETAMKAMQEE